MESNSKILKRIDVWLVDHGHAPSRAKAQELIDEGAVFIRGKLVEAASFKIDDQISSQDVRVDAQDVLRFVSRGGRKQAGALADFGIAVQNSSILDLGQSTGGFTDCVLQAGAREVVGIDVGREQIDAGLKVDPRVTVVEEVHLKDLAQLPVFHSGQRRFDLTVCDLSFISSLAQLPSILGWSPAVLILVKPQFELGPAALNKKGLVQRPELISDLKSRFQDEVRRLKYTVRGWMPSRLPGKDGNQEYFLYVTHND